MAHRASWRSDGSYRPIDRIDLVLLGDVLDITGSARWLETEARPWHNSAAPALVEAVSGIVDAILWQNSESLATLRSLASDGAVGIPPATTSGKAAYDAPSQTVPVRTHYMVGNHDWLLHVRGKSYDLMRQKVAHHAGLANAHHAPFPHDPLESEELLETLRRHRVLARHGDVFDPLHFSDDRDASSLGDALEIELACRFAAEIEQQLDVELPAALTAGLREIGAIRPLPMMPVWIDGLLERTCPLPAMRKRVKQIWDRLVDDLLQLDVVRSHDTVGAGNLVDGIDRCLKFSKRHFAGWSDTISQWLQSLRGAASDSYYHHALAEQDFRNRRARHVVYGHTHQAESLPLDASYADGYVLNQMYFNAGTWRRVFRPTQLSPGRHEFIGAEAMTYLAFYQGDERGGRPFETWTGALGASQGEPAGREPHSAAPAARHVPLAAPHFNTAAQFAQR